MQDLLAEGRRLGVRSSREWLNMGVIDSTRPGVKLCVTGCEPCREYRNAVRSELEREANRQQNWLDQWFSPKPYGQSDAYKVVFGYPSIYYAAAPAPVVAKPIVALAGEERFFDLEWQDTGTRLRVTAPSRNDSGAIGFDLMDKDEPYVASVYADMTRETAEALRNWLDAILRS